VRNADRLLHRQHEDLPVTDLCRSWPRPTIAAITFGVMSSAVTISSLIFGRKSTGVLAGRDRFRCGPFCRPNPFTSVTVMPSMPIWRQGLFHFLEFEWFDDRFRFFSWGGFWGFGKWNFRFDSGLCRDSARVFYTTSTKSPEAKKGARPISASSFAQRRQPRDGVGHQHRDGHRPPRRRARAWIARHLGATSAKATSPTSFEPLGESGAGTRLMPTSDHHRAFFHEIRFSQIPAVRSPRSGCRPRGRTAARFRVRECATVTVAIGRPGLCSSAIAPSVCRRSSSVPSITTFAPFVSMPASMRQPLTAERRARYEAVRVAEREACRH